MASPQMDTAKVISGIASKHRSRNSENSLSLESLNIDFGSRFSPTEGKLKMICSCDRNVLQCGPLGKLHFKLKSHIAHPERRRIRCAYSRSFKRSACTFRIKLLQKFSTSGTTRASHSIRYSSCSRVWSTCVVARYFSMVSRASVQHDVSCGFSTTNSPIFTHITWLPRC